MRKHYERILHDSESRVQRYLDIQILDENSPFCGGFPKADSLAEPKTAIYRATTMTACYLNPESRYYLDAELGRRLARELNIAYYDRDIILKTAKASAHLTPEQVRRWDERVPHEFGFTQSLFNFYNRPLSEELWDAQVRAIREIADRESCVIVGRNADYILREFDHCLRVFVHADRNWRLLHMRKLMPDTPFEQLEADMDSADRARRSYCKQHTGQIYGDSRNYDLTLCTSKLGLDKAEEILLCAAKNL